MSALTREIDRPHIGTAATLAYAQGSFGTGVFSTVPTVLLLYYCTEIIGLSPAWGAAIVFVPKVWAIAWDPLVGAWSDCTHGRFGRRRPFLAAGALGVATTFIALFSPPQFDSLQSSGLWIASAYFALATVYSLFAVPYIAIPAEIGHDPHTRSRLVGWRMTMAMIGVLAGAGLAPYLGRSMSTDQASERIILNWAFLQSDRSNAPSPSQQRTLTMRHTNRPAHADITDEPSAC